MSNISIVIPTYNRGSIALAALEKLFLQTIQPDQIIVVDQTKYAVDDINAPCLRLLHDEGRINWIRLEQPSIPHAMNCGLLEARSDFVLFLDDDSSASPMLIEQYRSLLDRGIDSGIVGQVLQPGESPVYMPSGYRSGEGLREDLHFKFNSNQEAWIADCIACNLLVNREHAIACGGFDEQFDAVAYRFETEFCRRLIRSTGQKLLFSPQASVDHLKVSAGGTRAKVANFLVSASPVHSQGDYYFALREASGLECWAYIGKRFFGSIVARFYLRNPWWIPIRLIGETRGLVAAISMNLKPPAFIQHNADQ